MGKRWVLAVLVLAVLGLSGCMPDDFQQTGTAYASCSGFIVIGCNPSVRNLIAPSPDEAMVIGVAAGVVALILTAGLLKERAEKGE